MTEHVHETYQALRTGEAAEADPFPPGEGAPVQYGPQARALALSLRDQRRLSCERAAELINGLAGYAMSQATAVNMALEAENSPAMLLFEAGAKARLAGAPVLRADETGVGTGGKTNWAHVAADDEFSLFCPHAGRGHEGAEAAGIIPERRPDRFLTRDRLQTYFGYDRKRCLCNARLLRDLQKCVDAGGGQKSPSRMQHPLSGLNAQTDAYGGKLPLSLQAGGRRTCETILAEGYAETGGRALARPPGGKKKRGRIRKTFCRNLLETLDVQEDAVLRFTTDAGIPFTNNLAERPVRMIKVRAKISGRFRSREHAVGFLRMRSCHDTCRKHGIGHYEAIKMCVEGKIPALVTEALSGKAKPQASRKAA